MKDFFLKLLRPAIEAIKKYALPFGTIQLCALAIVISYYKFESVRDFCVKIAEWKTEGGLIFAAITTAIAGGILPEIAKSLTGKALANDWARVKDTLFNCAYFAIIGILVDLLYRLQGMIFGYDLNWQTLVKKIIVDQFMANPLVLAPFSILFYVWREQNFHPIATLKQLNWTLYRNRTLPLLATIWLYWIPMAGLAYSMPSPLQFPFFVCANAAWGLLFVFIVKA